MGNGAKTERASWWVYAQTPEFQRGLKEWRKPFPQDFDTWPRKAQGLYELGRQHAAGGRDVVETAKQWTAMHRETSRDA